MKSNPALYKEPKEWPPGPPTCYTCRNYNYARSCQMIGPNVAIRKFTYPAKATDSAKRVEYRILLRDFETGRCSAASSDANRIEYWPYCGKWERGSPHYGTEKFVAENDPSNVGLVWINAAELGLKTGAANSFAG